MKVYWYPHRYNVGDTLTPHILAHFRPDLEIEEVPRAVPGKLLMVGSIMTHALVGDTVLGTGVMREDDRFPHAKDIRFLAVRGPLSRDILVRNGGSVPEVYGDPGLLLPLIYRPNIQKTHRVGVVPHYVDKHMIAQRIKDEPSMKDWKLIDVALGWRTFVEEMLKCEYIISSSLHGIVIAEAYGIPAEWAVYSDKVIGHGFKFRDYVKGTGRSFTAEPGEFAPIPDLERTQNGLIHMLSTI